MEVMTTKKHLGHYFKVMDLCMEHAMNAQLQKLDLTSAQGHIIGYLTHSKEQPCARDIEEAFQLSHPTVSGILSRLEQKDFIEMRPDELDRRCKRIYIREKGLQLDEMMHQTVRSTEERMVQGFTEDEKAQFADLLRRAIDNMGGNPCKRKHKEESQE